MRRRRSAAGRGAQSHDWLKLTLMMAAAGALASGGGTSTQGLRLCCGKAEGACRSVCDKMSMVEMSAGAADGAVREDALRNIYKFCSPTLVEFWICMNATIQAVVSGEEWWGRACCSLARGAACRRACVGSRDARSAGAACRRSDEFAFFDCLTRQQRAQDCCSQTQSVSCHEECRAALWGPGAGSRAAGALSGAACDLSPGVLACARNLTRAPVPIDTHKYVPCCAKGESAACQTACERALAGGSTGAEELVAALQAGGCRPPLPQVPLWQCVLRADSHADHLDALPLDGAKLHCCHKAVSERCQRLCFQTYGRAWLDNWRSLEKECLRGAGETALINCLLDVEEPCAPGCSGLTYCRHVHSRATLFRACDAGADLAAHRDVAALLAGGTVRVADRVLRVRAGPACSEELWRAVACVLQVKPCSVTTHTSRLCAADCARLASDCLSSDAAGHVELCASLAASPGEDCVSLDDFLPPGSEPVEREVSKEKDEESWSSGTSACAAASAPCNSTQVCAASGERHLCRPGCPVGAASALAVAAGVVARVVRGGAGCVSVCQCTARGVLQRCRPLPCYALEACALAGRRVPHGERFYLECNACRCYAGERVCERRACGVAGSGALLTGLPCNCPRHYLPVCVDGRTVASACLAKCLGHRQEELVSGRCGAACAGVVCPAGHTCVPRPAACLSPLQAPCHQYQCVRTSDCSAVGPEEEEVSEEACDTEGLTHASACELLSAGRELAYNGPCLTQCTGSNAGAVCGADGATYSSACVAAAARVSVDYTGACRAVGRIAARGDARPLCLLEGVSCAALPACVAFVAPGACCPRCGGALRLLYARKQVDRALYAGGREWGAALTARGVAAALQGAVAAGCAVRAHVTLERELWVSLEPSGAVLEGAGRCAREAERLAVLVNSDSARFAADLALSVLTLALPAHAPAVPPARASADPMTLLSLPLTLLSCYVYMYTHTLTR